MYQLICRVTAPTIVQLMTPNMVQLVMMVPPDLLAMQLMICKDARSETMMMVHPHLLAVQGQEGRGDLRRGLRSVQARARGEELARDPQAGRGAQHEGVLDRAGRELLVPKRALEPLYETKIQFSFENDNPRLDHWGRERVREDCLTAALHWCR